VPANDYAFHCGTGLLIRYTVDTVNQTYIRFTKYALSKAEDCFYFSRICLNLKRMSRDPASASPSL